MKQAQYRHDYTWRARCAIRDMRAAVCHEHESDLAEARLRLATLLARLEHYKLAGLVLVAERILPVSRCCGAPTLSLARYAHSHA